MNIHQTVKCLVVFIGGALSFKGLQESNWLLLGISVLISVFASLRVTADIVEVYNPCDDVIDDYYVRGQYQDTQEECDGTAKVVDVKHEE
jgi:hypothetical protein